MNKEIQRRSIILYYSFAIYIGMSGAIFGPSLLHLVDQTSSTLGLVSLLFPSRSFSYLAGSLIAGTIFDRYRGHKLLVSILPFIAITLGLIPFLRGPLILIVVSMIMALATGIADVGCNSLLFRVPDVKIAPAMSGYHFFFGLGSFLAPLALAGSLKFSDGLQWGFWGLGLASILIFIQFISLEGTAPGKSNQPVQGAGEKAKSGNRIQIIWVIGLFFFAFVGFEVSFGDWLSSYSILSGLADEKAAILLTSTFWGVFAFSRLISIPVAARLTPEKIVVLDLSGAILGLGLVYLFPDHNETLWVGAILVGLSLASLFPTMLTFAESLLSMTGRVTSIFFISGSAGAIFLPWLIGRFVDDLGPKFIIQVLYLTLLGAAFVFVILMRVSKKKPELFLRF